MEYKFEDVRCIPASAFEEKIKLSRVVLPDSLDVIGGSAFSRSGLTGSLSIPEGVKIVGGSAFSTCQNFTHTYHAH